jgi:hypothetical protein
MLIPLAHPMDSNMVGTKRGIIPAIQHSVVLTNHLGNGTIVHIPPVMDLKKAPAARAEAAFVSNESM